MVIKGYENNIKWGRKDIDPKDSVMANGGNMQQFGELLCFCLAQNSEYMFRTACRISAAGGHSTLNAAVLLKLYPCTGAELHGHFEHGIS